MDIQPVVTGPGSTFLQSLQLPSSIANTQANTALLGQQAAQSAAQTQGLNLANQKTSMLLSNLPGMIGALNSPMPTPGAQSAPSSGVPIGQTGLDGDDIQQRAFQQFGPISTAPPPQLAQKIAATTILYGPDAGNALKAQWDNQVQGVIQQRQIGATQYYLRSQSVATAPPSAAWDTLNRIDPQTAAQIKQLHPYDDPAQLDADTRQVANHTAAAMHQYSGRPIENQNGVFIDKVDGRPVQGLDQVLTGLDAAGKEKAYEYFMQPVTVGAGLSTPRFLTLGMKSPEPGVIAMDRAARSSAVQGTPGIPPGTAPQSQTVPGMQSAAAPQSAPGAAPQSQTVSGTQGATAPQSAPAPAQIASDPVMRNALSDTSFRQAPIPTPTDQPSLAAATDQAKANVAAGQTLKSDADDATKAAAQAQTYLMAAKSVMDSKGANVGAYGGLLAKASALLPGQSVDATNYQEVAKYLGNAALANARGIYGNRMTQSEVGLQLNELSPSVHMTDTAINGLLNTNLKATQYTIDSAGRVIPYLSARNDPTNFAKWNQKYWNQSSTVNPAPATKTAPAGALSYLTQHPEAAAAFKAKYGYLPNGQ